MQRVIAAQAAAARAASLDSSSAVEGHAGDSDGNDRHSSEYLQHFAEYKRAPIWQLCREGAPQQRLSNARLPAPACRYLSSRNFLNQTTDEVDSLATMAPAANEAWTAEFDREVEFEFEDVAAGAAAESSPGLALESAPPATGFGVAGGDFAFASCDSDAGLQAVSGESDGGGPGTPLAPASLSAAVAHDETAIAGAPVAAPPSEAVDAGGMVGGWAAFDDDPLADRLAATSRNDAPTEEALRGRPRAETADPHTAGQPPSEQLL